VINTNIRTARVGVQCTTVGSGTSYVGPFTQTTYCNRDYPRLCWQHERESVSKLRLGEEFCKLTETVREVRRSLKRRA